jgi:hypothetical protein
MKEGQHGLDKHKETKYTFDGPHLSKRGKGHFNQLKQ